MTQHTTHEIRPGAYYDSVVLMQLQKSLLDLPGVVDAGVVMATAANREVLTSTGFEVEGINAKPDDLLIMIKGETASAATDALGEVDSLLKRRSATTVEDFRPRSLAAAVRNAPDAHWVLLSVPGRFAAGVAKEALNLGKHVFMYSDNVSLAEEVELKQLASEKGRLLMGPDCGTAIINGVGLGFANRVRRGKIGVVAASGTGLQAVTVAIHAQGAGISQAIGTGGRDLKSEVGGVTMLQALYMLQQDEETELIVLISKPPAPEVAARLLAAAQAAGKPVVVNFIGYPASAQRRGNLFFASTLAEAARLAVERLADEGGPAEVSIEPLPAGRHLRGLFSGGTLAYEALLALQATVYPLFSNIPIHAEQKLEDVWQSEAHTIIDMGEDAFTQGRLHPMMDNDLRIRRLRQEGADPTTGMILLDVVLGEGSHPNPAAELSPAIAEITESTDIELVALLLATEDDPQDVAEQIKLLESAGATVFRELEPLLDYVAARLNRPVSQPSSALPAHHFKGTLNAINVGVETFFHSLQAQGAEVTQVDWRPPAGGNEKLMAILAKMKKT